MISGPLLQLKISISESDIPLGDSRRKEVTNERMEEWGKEENDIIFWAK